LRPLHKKDTAAIGANLQTSVSLRNLAFFKTFINI